MEGRVAAARLVVVATHVTAIGTRHAVAETHGEGYNAPANTQKGGATEGRVERVGMGGECWVACHSGSCQGSSTEVAQNLGSLVGRSSWVHFVVAVLVVRDWPLGLGGSA